MLKTSSTYSIEPRKGVVGVGGSGRNKAKPVDKHEDDGSDDGGHVDGGSRSGDYDRNSSNAPKLICPPAPLISRLRMSSSTDSSTSAAQIVVKYDEIDDVRWCWWQVGLANGSKNRQRVQKALKI